MRINGLRFAGVPNVSATDTYDPPPAALVVLIVMSAIRNRGSCTLLASIHST
jgi:hypothetical protein